MSLFKPFKTSHIALDGNHKTVSLLPFCKPTSRVVSDGNPDTAGPHEKVQGRRGRPPGSKNKRTLAMESLAQQGLTAGQQQAAMALLKQRAEQKRQEDEDNMQAAIASGQKRRGRPPGSRNRPRDDGKITSHSFLHVITFRMPVSGI